MIATSALWHNHLNQTEQALNVCGDVIYHILPEVGKTNVDNSNQLGVNYLLYPIIRVLIAQGQDGVNRAYEVYTSHMFFIHSIQESNDRPLGLDSFGEFNLIFLYLQ